MIGHLPFLFVRPWRLFRHHLLLALPLLLAIMALAAVITHLARRKPRRQ